MTTDDRVVEQGRSLHACSLVIDASQSAPLTEEQLGRIRAGGITVANATIVHPEADFAASVRAVAKAHRFVEAHAGEVIHVTRAVDVTRARAEGKVGVAFAFQHAPVERGLDDLDVFHRHLTWFIYEMRMVEGLDSTTKFGRVTEELVRRGYPDDAIGKLLGGNFLRLFGQVWG